MPSGLVRSGKPYLCRALLLVTRGSLFWIVAVGPEKTAILGLTEGAMAVIPFSYCERVTMCAPCYALPQGRSSWRGASESRGSLACAMAADTPDLHHSCHLRRIKPLPAGAGAASSSNDSLPQVVALPELVIVPLHGDVQQLI